MGRAIGADLANMWDLWRFPTAAIPGEEYAGKPLSRMVAGERSLPGTIMVNHKGRRFVNEAHPYTDVGGAFMTWDPVESTYENYPAWSLFDHDFRETYSVLSLTPEDKDPDWLTRAESIEDLARPAGHRSAGPDRDGCPLQSDGRHRPRHSTSCVGTASSITTTPTSVVSPARPWVASNVHRSTP